MTPGSPEHLSAILETALSVCREAVDNPRPSDVARLKQIAIPALEVVIQQMGKK